MGYTRYWTIKKLEEKKFNHFIHICKIVVEGSHVPLTIEYVDDNGVCFNGVEDDGHETFEIRRYDTGFQFCKTARKPYDEIVCAILDFASNIFKEDIEVSCDGDNDDQESINKYKTLIRDKKIDKIFDESIHR